MAYYTFLLLRSLYSWGYRLVFRSKIKLSESMKGVDYMITESRKATFVKYRKKNKAKITYIEKKSHTKNFILNYSTLEDLDFIKELIEQRKEYLYSTKHKNQVYMYKSVSEFVEEYGIDIKNNKEKANGCKLYSELRGKSLRTSQAHFKFYLELDDKTAEFLKKITETKETVTDEEEYEEEDKL